MAESQKKSKGGRKPKYDYKSEEFLSLVESYAKKGFTDKEIACAIGIAPQKFSEKKSELSELSEVLSRARSAIKRTCTRQVSCDGIGRYQNQVGNTPQAER